MDYKKLMSTTGKMCIKWLPIILFATIITLVLYQNFFFAQFPYTHDGENHLARFANYKIAVREGQIPPRWAPNLLNRYGYPVFNYNYPLSNILSLPFSILGVHYETTFKLLTFGYLVFGAVGVYAWLKKLRFRVFSSILGTTFWLSMPYIATLLFYRGSIGEIAAIGIFPWILWSLWRIKEDSVSTLLFVVMSVLFTAFLLAHNVTAVFALPILGIIALWLYRKNFSKWLQLANVSGMSFLLTAWFWIPALAEIPYTNVTQTSNQLEYLEHFSTVSQLLFSPIDFGFSLPGPVDSLGLSLNWLLVLLAILGGGWLVLKKFIFKNTNRYFGSVILLFIISLLLFVFQLNMTAPIWSAMPFVRFIQFPWRLMIFFAAIVVPVAVYGYRQLPRVLKWVVIVVLLLQLSTVQSLRAVDYFHKNRVDYDAFTQTTSTQNENLPVDFTYENIADWEPRPKVMSGYDNVTVEYWTGSARKYEVRASVPTLIVEPTARFPGWQTEVTNQLTGKKRKIAYIDNSAIQGRIGYELEPGVYTVVTRFTQNTVYRMVGNLLTGIGIIYMVFLLIRPKLRKSYE